MDAADNLRPVVTGRGFIHTRPMLHPAAFWIIGAEYQPADTKETGRLRAHRAGLKRDVEVAVRQARLSADGGGGAQGEKLGVGGGVATAFHLVAGTGERGAVRSRYHGADRHLATGGGLAGFVKGDFHGNHEGFLPGHVPAV